MILYIYNFQILIYETLQEKVILKYFHRLVSVINFLRTCCIMHVIERCYKNIARMKKLA